MTKNICSFRSKNKCFNPKGQVGHYCWIHWDQVNYMQNHHFAIAIIGESKQKTKWLDY